MNRFAFVLALLTVLSAVGLAQWSNNPAVNTALAVGKDERYDLNTISDASGNTYVTWYANSTGTTSGVYVQKISLTGALPWGAGGVRVQAIAQTAEKPSLSLDGSGGVFVTWVDTRPTNDDQNIYGQHITSAGTIQWSANGANLTQIIGLSFRSPGNPQMLSDGSNGTYLSWDDAFGLQLMRISSNGVVAWNTYVDSTFTNPTDTRIASDGAGGVILAWSDARNGVSGDFGDIYAQRVDPSGTNLWTLGGVVVSSATNMQIYPQIVADGSGGAIIAWQDFRDAAHFRPYGQKLNASGVSQWTANGLSLCSTGNAVNQLVLSSDGAGGAIFTWDESRPTDENIYAQRVNAAGAIQWGATAAAVCTNSSPQANPEIVADGSGGAIIAWDDNRHTGINADIYAQRLNAGGVPQWTTDGVAVSTAPNDQRHPLVASYPNNSAVVVWYDFRVNGGSQYAEIYAQYVSAGGALSRVQRSSAGIPESFALDQNFPNPFNPSTEIKFQIASGQHTNLTVYNTLGQQVRALVDGEMNAGSYSVTWDGKDDRGAQVSSGMYLYRLEAGNSVAVKRMVMMK